MLKFYLIICLLGSIYCQEITSQKNVSVLTEDNFESFIEKNEHCLVTFYAPWCGPCRMLKPEFEKAAALLLESGSKAKLGKVDATVHTTLANEHVVRGFPTIKFFRNGSSLHYTGGRIANELYQWVLRKSQPALHELKTIEDSNIFVSDKNEDVKIMGFFSNPSGPGAKAYRTLAEAADFFKFGITSSAQLFSFHKAADKQLIMFRKFDENNAVFKGPHTEYFLRKFLEEQSVPPIIDLTHQNIKRVLSRICKHILFLFLSRDNGHYETHVEQLYPLAKKHRELITFVTVNGDDPTFVNLFKYFKLKREQMPVMRILQIEGPAKFKPAFKVKNITPKTVNKFISSYFNHQAKEDLQGQELPADWDAKPVKVLVTSNFKKIVYDKSKTVMVDFFAPWCGPCKLLEPEYDELGKMFEKNKTVLIAKIDSTQNEVSGTRITSLPTIKLYTKSNRKVLDYTGRRTAVDMARFIEKYHK